MADRIATALSQYDDKNIAAALKENEEELHKAMLLVLLSRSECFILMLDVGLKWT